MERQKTKIVLDADVIIHFMKAGSFPLLPEIFPEYDFLILDVVYQEVAKQSKTKNYLDKYLALFPKMRQERFVPRGEAMKEFFSLQQNLGRGESACMVYCKYNQDVLGSSNLRDIKGYCAQNGIAYLTTIDFLYYAYCKGKMTEQECREFIETVRSKGSVLPDIDITKYICTVSV